MSSWIKSSIFYSIFTLGYCGVLERNKVYKPANRLEKIEKLIPHLKKMHVNAVYFTPVFESTYHGYDTIDYKKIDPRLGTNEDFKELCQTLHDNGIKIVLDGVFNHVGRDFWAFKDVQKNGPSSPYCSWFANLNFNGRSPMGDNFSYEGWSGCYDLVKLNLWNNDVVQYLFGAVKMWIEEFDIDGIRLDAAANISRFEFFKELKDFTKNLKDDFWLMGEVVGGDYSRWANPQQLDSTTNYECYKGIYSSHNDKNYFEIAHSLNRMFGNGGIYQNLTLYNFVDNHDVNRVASTVKYKEYLKNIYTILYTMPGVPSIYYGSEYGAEGTRTSNSDAALRPSAEDLEKADKNLGLFQHIKLLGKIREENDALINGAFRNVIIRNQQLVYERKSDKQTAYIALNLSDQPAELDFDIDFNEGEDLLSDADQIFHGRHIKLNVPAFSSKIIVKHEI